MTTWPLRIRVTGGRVWHRARAELDRRGRPTGWLEIACHRPSWRVPADVAGNSPADRDCPACGRRAAARPDRRKAAAQRRAAALQAIGQFPLFTL